MMRSTLKDIDNVIQTIDPITLDEMDGIKLMNRSDTKFIFNIGMLHDVIKSAADHYRILEIDKKRLLNYKTVYYDTNEFRLYRDHQNGRLNRYKIRQRMYLDSNLCFMEIKLKNNKSKTIKNRIKINDLELVLSERSKTFINNFSPVRSEELGMSLINRFSRITLANNVAKERITIDLKLSYEKENEFLELSNLVVAEVKQEGFSNSSEFIKILKANRIYPTGMSKYCVGMLSFHKNLKYNNFKPRLLKINKINNEVLITKN